MMRLPSERERELFLELAPWFDHIGDNPSLKADAPDNIKKDFEGVAQVISSRMKTIVS